MHFALIPLIRTSLHLLCSEKIKKFHWDVVTFKRLLHRDLSWLALVKHTLDYLFCINVSSHFIAEARFICVSSLKDLFFFNALLKNFEPVTKNHFVCCTLLHSTFLVHLGCLSWARTSFCSFIWPNALNVCGLQCSRKFCTLQYKLADTHGFKQLCRIGL